MLASFKGSPVPVQFSKVLPLILLLLLSAKLIAVTQQNSGLLAMATKCLLNISTTIFF
jgi:hypothetical protein